MSEFSNHENTDGSRPPVEGIPVVPASEAPTVVAAVAAAEGHPITPAALPLRTLTTEPGTPERDAELARWAADDARAAERPCVAAASPAWPGPETCRQRWPEIPRGWCAGCKSAPDVEVGAGFIRVGGTVYASGPLGEWPTSEVPPPVEPIPSYGDLVAERGGDLDRPLQDEAIELLTLTADYPLTHPLRRAARRLVARLARDEARIIRARALHRNNDEGDRGSCTSCSDRDYVGLVDDEWPCPTLKALDGTPA